MESLDTKQHVLFALRHAKYLPTPYEPEDANRMTLGYFCLSALALLPSPVSAEGSDPSGSALDSMLRPVQTQGFIDWVYEQQVPSGGFRGSNSIECPVPPFSLFPASQEPGDPRTTYSAFAIASMLNDWNTIDIDSALGFLDSCRRYEGGFAQRPHLEANAGPTYCAIAAYHLSGRLPQLEAQDSLLRWLLARQVHPSPPSSPSEPSSSSDDEDQDEHEPSTLLPFESCAGFQGRTNKPLDACYSFWNLAALRLLVPNDLESLIDPTLNTTFLLHCQHPQFGGIAREPKAMPDIMHTYLSLAALSIENSSSNHYNREEEEPCRRLAELDVAWNVEVKVANRFRDKIAALQ